VLDEEEGRFLCETGGSEEDMVGLTTKGSWRWWEEEGVGREPAMEGGRDERCRAQEGEEPLNLEEEKREES